MKKRILLGLAGLLTLSVAAFAVVISHDSECAPAPVLAADAERMTAVMQRCYGKSPWTLEQIAKTQPTENRILVRVHAASINPLDWHVATGKPYLMRMGAGIGAPNYPRTGVDFAGTVEAVGPKVTRFKVGDEVFGVVQGAFAQYITVRETAAIVHKPANVSFEQAAALPVAAVTALQGLRDHGALAPGQRVLINGASGGVGTFAVQLAKHFGADVTGVCSTRNVELVRSLGADRVFDYTQQDFASDAARYDLILDNVGNRDLLDLRKVLVPGGRAVFAGAPKKGPWIDPFLPSIKGAIISQFVDEKLGFFLANVTTDDLKLLADLASEGKLRAVIDRRYPLAEAPAALEYIGSQRARGKVILTTD